MRISVFLDREDHLNTWRPQVIRTGHSSPEGRRHCWLWLFVGPLRVWLRWELSK